MIPFTKKTQKLPPEGDLMTPFTKTTQLRKRISHKENYGPAFGGPDTLVYIYIDINRYIYIYIYIFIYIYLYIYTK